MKIDRKKVERAIKKTQKQLSETQTSREKAKFEKILFELQIDLNYILVSPLLQLKKTFLFYKYFNLFLKIIDSIIQRIENIWHFIQQMEEMMMK